MVQTYGHHVSEEHFNIFSLVKFTTNRTRSSSNCKLKCILPKSSNNHLKFVFFNRVVKLWNALPIIDLHLSINILKHNLYAPSFGITSLIILIPILYALGI